MTATPAQAAQDEVARFLTANDFKRMELIRGNVKVELDWLCEGLHGNYDPADPNDAPLLRFYVYQRRQLKPTDVDDGRLIRAHQEGEDWLEVDNTSYRTRLKVTDPRGKLQGAIDFIMDLVEPRMAKGLGITRICKWLANLHKAGITVHHRNTGM